MTPIEVVSVAEEGKPVGSILRSTCESGTNAAFFSRVAELLGSDPEAALRLGSAWKSFAKHGDQPEYAFRVKGAIERLEGRWLSSANSFLKAGEISRDPGFSVGAIDSLARSGQIGKAVDLGKSIVRKLRQEGRHDVAARAQLNTANAHLWADQYDQARKAYEAARPNLTGVDAVAATLGLSTCELFGGSLDRAEKLINETDDSLKALGLPGFIIEVTVNRAHIAILRGAPEEALDLLQGIRRAKGAEGTWARIEEFIGDAFLRLNLYDEAEDAYQEAIKLNPPALNSANAYLGIGQAQLAGGRFTEAVAMLRKAARAYRRIGNRPWEWAAKTMIAEAQRGQGNPKYAEMAKKAAHQLALLGSPYHEAKAWLAAGMNHRRTKFLVKRHGSSSLLWQVYALEAANSKSPLRAYRRMFSAMVASRLTTRSYSARMSFLRDKESALRSYLGHLLRIPRKAQIAEALDVIQQTRAVTLLDEIASAHLSDQPDWLEDLAALRKELVADDQELPGSSTRRRFSGAAPTKMDKGLLTPLMHAIPGPSERITILIETSDFVHLLSDGACRRVELSDRELAKKLRWLCFDLTEPLLRPVCDSRSTVQRLDALQEVLGKISTKILCPDRSTWGVPWQLLTESEIALALSPSFCGAPHGWKLPSEPNVAIWEASTTGLPHAKEEITRLTSLFPDATVFRTLSEVRQAKGNFDIVHVVGHARLNEGNPMYSSIEFSDGYLSAIEIARSSLSVGLAVLAACDTGRIETAFPGEPDGLVRAFLARKAEAVVASSWQWDDEAALIFVDSLYACLLQSDLGTSMETARRHCKERKTHPFFWGAPVLFAGYGSNASNVR